MIIKKETHSIYLEKQETDLLQSMQIIDLKSSIPYLATTASHLLKKQDFVQAYSSCPGLVPLPYLLSLFHYQMRLHQATFVHANVKRTHVHATAQSLSLREEGELVCNWVTPVG